MNLKTVSVISGVVLSVAAALAVFGVEEVPRFAWSSEVTTISEGLVELDSRVTIQQLDDTKQQYFQNTRERNKYPMGEEPPPYLLDERILLERKMDDLEHRLEILRGSE